jgi:hypothetical protein
VRQLGDDARQCDAVLAKTTKPMASRATFGELAPASPTGEFKEGHGRGVSLPVGKRTKRPVETQPWRWPDGPKVPFLSREAHESYENIIRATERDDKQLTEYIRNNLTVIVPDCKRLTGRDLIIRKHEKGK